MRTLTPPAPRSAPGAPRIDPRIRERRIAVTRRRGRRRLRVVIGALTAVAAAVLAVVVLHLSVFRVAHIEVRGAARSGAAGVDAAARVALHRPMLSLDTASVARRIDRLPWVATTRITKSWPSTLVVTVVERTPVAQVADASRWALLDATGRVVAVDNGRVPGLAVLAWSRAVPGPGSRLPGSARAPLAVAAGLAPFSEASPTVPQPVVSLAAGPGGGVVLNLADGAAVDLGPPTDVTSKLTALATLESEVDLSGVKAIDLRVPGQPVLTRG